MFTQEAVAGAIISAITSTPALGIEAFTYGGGTVYARSTNGGALPTVNGLLNGAVLGIKDLAGNALQPNRIVNQTRFTILLGGDLAYDFGDAESLDGQNSAPQTIVGFDSTGAAIDGARHVILTGADFQYMPVLGGDPDSEANGVPTTLADGDGADEDGLQLLPFRSVFNPIYNRSCQPKSASMHPPMGMVDVWIDWNLDGDFDDPFENVVKNQTVWGGRNTVQIVTPFDDPANFTDINYDVFNPYNAVVAPGLDRMMRVRVSQDGNLRPDQVVVGGEVEDYVIQLSAGTPPIINDDQFAWLEDTAAVDLSNRQSSVDAIMMMKLRVPARPQRICCQMIQTRITVVFSNSRLLILTQDVSTSCNQACRLAISLEDQLNVTGTRAVAGTLMVDEFGNFSFATAANYNTDNFPSNRRTHGDRQLKFLYRAIDNDGVPSFHADGFVSPGRSHSERSACQRAAPVPVNDGTIEVLEDLDGEAATSTW